MQNRQTVTLPIYHANLCWICRSLRMNRIQSYDILRELKRLIRENRNLCRCDLKDYRTTNTEERNRIIDRLDRNLDDVNDDQNQNNNEIRGSKDNSDNLEEDNNLNNNLNRRVTALELGLNTANNRLDIIEGRMEILTNRVDTLTNRVDTLTGTVDNLSNRMDI